MYENSYVSVIIPCLNEEEGIGICLNKIISVFKTYKINGEIIVVDNGCTDNTINIVKSFNSANIKIVKELKKGYGNAYKSGFKEAKGEIIIVGDGDNSYDFYDIPRFLKAIKNYDFVLGNRAVIDIGAMPFLHKYIGRPMFYFLMRNLFNLEISDSHCGFAAIRKEALRKLNLKSSGMEFASEILIKAKKNNLKISEIPITYYPRMGKSKLRTLHDGLRHLNLIILERMH
ncbi:MAG: glycosyltransferase family 2 protein [Candidatus Pacearchaeota archaeon]